MLQAALALRTAVLPPSRAISFDREANGQASINRAWAGAPLQAAGTGSCGAAPISAVASPSVGPETWMSCGLVPRSRPFSRGRSGRLGPRLPKDVAHFLSLSHVGNLGTTWDDGILGLSADVGRPESDKLERCPIPIYPKDNPRSSPKHQNSARPELENMPRKRPLGLVWLSSRR